MTINDCMEMLSNKKQFKLLFKDGGFLKINLDCESIEFRDKYLCCYKWGVYAFRFKYEEIEKIKVYKAD